MFQEPADGFTRRQGVYGAGRGDGERTDRIGVARGSGDVAGTQELSSQRGGKRISCGGGIDGLHVEGRDQVAVFTVIDVAAARAELEHDVADRGLRADGH